MLVRLFHPLIVEIAHDPNDMADAVDALDALGFMPRHGFDSIYPYEDSYDEFFERTKTEPTHFLLVDSNVDPNADGLVFELCGQREIERTQNRLKSIREMDFAEFRYDYLDEWLNN